MAKQSTRSRARQASRTHRIGTGPGDVYVHAVRRRTRPDGPVALCGHPLRAGPPNVGDEAAAAESFEELVASYWGACPRCCDLLGLEPGDRESFSSDGDEAEGPFSWKKLGPVAIGGAVGLIVLVRILVLILQRS